MLGVKTLGLLKSKVFHDPESIKFTTRGEKFFERTLMTEFISAMDFCRFVAPGHW